MEDVIFRFPHLGVQIFQELDVGSLLNCKQVSRSWKNFIETEKPLNDKFVIMRLVYGYWKALPTCLDWVENNFDFIMYKFKRRGIHYNISYTRIIIPSDLKNLQSETEFDEKGYQRVSCNLSSGRTHTHPAPARTSSASRCVCNLFQSACCTHTCDCTSQVCKCLRTVATHSSEITYSSDGLNKICKQFIYVMNIIHFPSRFNKK